jgi:hypothetical protein
MEYNFQTTIDKRLYPDEWAIAKYEYELEYWQEKYDIANEAHDWSARNEAAVRLAVKKEKLAELKIKVGRIYKKTKKIKL